MHRFIPVLAMLQGLRVVEMPVHHRPRVRGVSKYGVARFFRRACRPRPDRRAEVARPGADVDAVGRVAGPAAARRVRHPRGRRPRRAARPDRLGRERRPLALEKRLVDRGREARAEAGGEADVAAIRARSIREKRLLRPFLSGNDRSRWLTIRALVERGTFAIEDLVVEPGWDTIDAVVHPDPAGRLHLYSSKPPLLSVLCAGPYWLLHRVTGWTLGDHPFEVGRL